MSVLDPLKNAVRRDRSTYVCRFCNLSFDRELRNCPACGCSDVESV
jgi:rubrerythrin